MIVFLFSLSDKSQGEEDFDLSCNEHIVCLCCDCLSTLAWRVNGLWSRYLWTLRNSDPDNRWQL